MTSIGPRPDLDALVLLVHQGRLSEAESRTRALIARSPEDGMLWKILGVALVRQRKDGLDALTRAAALRPDDPEAHRNLGAALHDREQWAPALASLRRALELAPDDIDALIDAGNALRGLKQPREAMTCYERALALDGNRAEAHNNLGNAWLELRDFTKAAAAYRRALTCQPDDVQILCNLSNAERRLRDFDRALAHSSRAVDLDPHSSVAHYNHARTQASAGEHEGAIASYRRALELSPTSIDALQGLANVLRDLGRNRDALPLYARALELDPSRADSHCNLGTLLFELRRVPEAMTCFYHALEVNPGHASAHLHLGMALRQQRRHAEAEASCDAALALDADHAEALALRGELLADRGRFAEAEALFERALAIDPTHAFALSSIATHRKMTTDDRRWLERAQQLLGPKLPLGHQIGLHYSLGKYHDDTGGYASAFAHYQRANELTKLYGARYDGARFTAHIDGIIQSFDAEFLARSRPGAATMPTPVFIVGMPRSGTSLLEQILASTPAVFGAGEVTFWNEAYATHRQTALPVLAERYLAQLRAASGDAGHVIDKMPANFLYAGLIHAALPRARIIHVQRHPADTCLSIYFQNFFNLGPHANDLHALAHYYREYRRIVAHWRDVLPADAWLDVHYESLIDDPETWVRRMLDFIGLPWDPRCLDFHATDRVVITASKWQVRQKLSAASVARWRHYEPYLGPLSAL